MADIREQILSRLAVVCAGITGIVAVARNELDVPGLARPAIIILDGAVVRVGDEPRMSSRYVFAEKQLMELRPVVDLRLRADTGSEGGALTSLFFGRVLNAVTGDAQLRALCVAILLESFSRPEPTPENKEQPKASFEFAFRYMLTRSELPS